MTDLPFGELLLAEQIHDVWRPKRQELVDAESTLAAAGVSVESGYRAEQCAFWEDVLYGKL